MKEHKANLKKLTKKQLIDQVLIGTEINAQIGESRDRRIKELEQFLASAENALRYKEEVIERYKTLLSTSVEDL